MSDVNIITIDGPSGTGKGTVCIYLTKLLNWHFLDSGALYRVLAYAAETLGVNYENEVELVKLVKRLNIEFKLLNHCFASLALSLTILSLCPTE